MSEMKAQMQVKKQYQVRAKNLFDPAGREPFQLSRSKFEDFLNCPRCFYMDRRLGLGKPDTPPFQLNKAVDELFKREFDSYRAKKEPHPLMIENRIDAVPFAHQDIGVWRENFTGLRHHHLKTNFIVFGAIDDVWQKPNGELIVVDYKATWSTKEATLDSEWRQSWKRQLEVYQWLFRRMGFQIAKECYFVYCNAKTSGSTFQKRLDFDVSLLKYEANDSWIEGKLTEARACLLSPAIPPPAPGCDYCAYKKASALLAEKYRSA